MNFRLTPRHFLALFCGALALLFVSGCYVSHEAVKERDLPADWRSAIDGHMTTPESFAGTYENIGEAFTRWMNNRGEGPRQIRAFLWLAPGENSRTLGPGTRTVEVVVLSPTQLQFIAREGGRVLNEEIRNVRWDPATHSFVDQESQGMGTQGPTVAWSSRHLYKGGDGRLYEETNRGERGPSIYVAPVSITHGNWSRWTQVAPAKARR